jgi:hypothetical protein
MRARGHFGDMGPLVSGRYDYLQLMRATRAGGSGSTAPLDL